MPAPEPLLTIWDIVEAGITEPFKRLIGALTPEPTQRDYAIWPEGYKEGSEFVADEEAKVVPSVLVDDVVPEKAVENCRVCGNEVKVMCLVGTGICSILCEKVDKAEITKTEATAITEGTTIESGIKS